MKHLLLSTGVAIVLIASPSLFAGPEPLGGKDSKAVVQPVVEKECTWTGFYIGGHGGYAWGGGTTFRELGQTDPGYDFDRDGFLGGGQVGFNLQLGRFFVIGIEGTFSAGDFSDKTRNDIAESDGRLDSNWMATAAARVGISFCQNHLLAYLKGGAAFTDYDFDTREIGDNGRFHADDSEVMGLIGFGLEYAFNCHWSVRVEYNHLFASDNNDVTGVETDPPDRFDTTFRVRRDDWNLVTAGLNFKF